MILLHNIGPRFNSNYNTREEIQLARGPLSFDGVYLNVWANKDILIGREVTLFVMGNYVGRDNYFDVQQNPHLKRENFCDWYQLETLNQKYQCRLGWHTWSHRDLTTLTDDEVRRELTLPDSYDIDSVLAYPYGKFNDRVEAIAIEMGFSEAYSVNQGDGSQFQKNRNYLNW